MRVGRATEEPAVDLRVQRLHATVEDFGRAGVSADLFDRDAGGGEGRRGSTGGENFDAELVQLDRKAEGR